MNHILDKRRSSKIDVLRKQARARRYYELNKQVVVKKSLSPRVIRGMQATSIQRSLVFTTRQQVPINFMSTDNTQYLLRLKNNDIETAKTPVDRSPKFG